MNMKRYFKRVNRGLLLSLVAVGVMAVYVSADMTNFNDIKPELTDYVRQYMDRACALAITPEEFRDGKAFTAEEARADHEKYTALLDEFFTQEINTVNLLGSYELTDKNDLLSYFDTSPETGYVTDCHVKSFKFNNDTTKIGPNLAMVSYSLVTEVEFWGKPAIFIPDSPISAEMMGYTVKGYEMTERNDDMPVEKTGETQEPEDTQAPEKTEETNDSVFHHYTMEVPSRGDMYLYYDDDGCKIIGVISRWDSGEMNFKQLDAQTKPISDAKGESRDE